MVFYRYFFILIVLFLASCTSVIDKPDKKNLIREKDLVPLLTEIQLANGLISNPVIQDWVTKIDSTTYYYIAEKHGYTKEAIDRTLRYYFQKNPKKLVAIYEKTLAKLSEMESLLDKQIKIETERKAHIWTGEKNYYYPVSTKAADFEVEIFGNDSYLLKFIATLFPDDQSINAKARLYAVGADSVLTGQRIFFETPQYIKDGRPHEYEIKISLDSYRRMILKGSLYDIANNITKQQRHISFENIELRNLSPNL